MQSLHWMFESNESNEADLSRAQTLHTWNTVRFAVVFIKHFELCSDLHNFSEREKKFAFVGNVRFWGYCNNLQHPISDLSSLPQLCQHMWSNVPNNRRPALDSSSSTHSLITNITNHLFNSIRPINVSSKRKLPFIRLLVVVHQYLTFVYN